MGSGWMIKTFDRARWDGIFGNGSADAEQKIIDAMLWENDGYFDDDAANLQPGPNRTHVLSSREGRQARRLAKHLAFAGFTYEGLDAAQAIRLDEFGALLGSSEGLGDELDVKSHSPDFFHQSYAFELLNRIRSRRSWLSRLSFGLLGRQPTHTPVQHLPSLSKGRRFGTDAQPTMSALSFYVILSPAEAAELRQEVEMAKAAIVPWRDAWGLAETEDYLLAPLAKAIESRRWVLMTLNY